MSEPTEAVYEGAYEAFKRVPYGSSIVRAMVDFVWPIAIAEGRRQAAADIRAQMVAPAEPPVPLRSGAVIRANSVAEWAAAVAEGTDDA